MLDTCVLLKNDELPVMGFHVLHQKKLQIIRNKHINRILWGIDFHTKTQILVLYSLMKA